MNIDEACFQEHVGGFNFQEGVVQGKWGLHVDEAVQWPKAVIWVAAAPRNNAPDLYFLYFDLDHYPKVGPTAYLRDPATKTALATTKFPVGNGDVGMTFRRTHWRGFPALYCPWDRDPVKDHPDWLTKHQGLIWKPEYTIVHYLRRTHELLNSNDYQGC